MHYPIVAMWYHLYFYILKFYPDNYYNKVLKKLISPFLFKETDHPRYVLLEPSNVLLKDQEEPLYLYILRPLLLLLSYS